MKKIAFILLMTFILLVIFTTGVNGNTYSGYCGGDIRYELNTVTGLIELYGDGPMKPHNYASSDPVWNSQLGYIRAVRISDGVTSIIKRAFGYCTKLKSVTIPKSITTIYTSAFYGCSSLTDIYYAGSESEWRAVTIKDGNTPLKEAAVHYNHDGHTYSGSCGENVKYTLDTVSGELVISGIGNMEAFSDYKKVPWNSFADYITEIKISKGVTSIGNYAFYACKNLYRLDLGDNIRSIGKYAFDGCKVLSEIKIPGNVTDIEMYAFNGCANLRSVTMNNKVTKVNHAAFESCSLLENVYYSGSAEEWARLSVSSNNTYFKEAAINYNCVDNYEQISTRIYNCSVAGNNGQYSCSFNVDAYSGVPGMVTVALYDGEKFVAAVSERATTDNYRFDKVILSAEATKYKVFFWEDCGNTAPLCQCATGYISLTSP